MSQSKAQKAAAKAAKAVASAYKRSLTAGGNYANSPAVRAITAKMESDLNAQALAALGGVVMSRPRKQRPKLTTAEKKARARVLSAHRMNAAKAARLGGGKRRGKKKTSKRKTTRVAAPRAAAPAARRASKPKVKTVTYKQVIAAAAQGALKRWACEGARRSGCGAGGSRVVNHSKGMASLVRIRPPRFITA